MTWCNINRKIDDGLQNFFYHFGRFIGSHVGYFIVVPILLTALCATGFQRMIYRYDPEYLFSPSNGRAKAERAVFEKHFPTNYSEFDPKRLLRRGFFARIIVETKDESESMTNTKIWNQLLKVEEMVTNVTIESRGGNVTYDHICAKWIDKCLSNSILEISDLIPAIQQKQMNMTYPIFFDPTRFKTYALPAYMGGVELFPNSNTVRKVRSVGLSYFLNHNTPASQNIGDEWERKVLNTIQSQTPTSTPDLNVEIYVSNTQSWEMERSRKSVNNILIVNVIFMTFFSMFAATMGDNVQSKSILGFIGLSSAALGTIAGFGFACYIGVEFISLNMAAPFLLLGIGIDDTFVVLSSWRRTSKHLEVPERLGRAMRDAAVSITVTSLTNFLSFVLGSITPFASVRIFCLYAGISVAFIFLWHCTLFSAVLAIAGYMEKSNRHALCCIKVTPKSKSQNRNFLYRWFMSGGVDKDNPTNPIDNKEHIGMVFLRDKVGWFLHQTWAKILVFILYTVYITFAVWGFMNIKEGINIRDTVNFDSYFIDYYNLEESYFKSYKYTIGVVFSGEDELNFSNTDTQEKIEKIMEEFEKSRYINGGGMTTSWLRDFSNYVNRTNEFSDDDGEKIIINNQQNFSNHLNQYLYDEFNYNHLNLDIDWKENGTGIEAARFLIQGENVSDSRDEQDMLYELRDICDKHSTREMSVNVFHPYFIFIDQYQAITPQTIQCIAITASVMIVVATLLIPSLICSFWVSFSILSIELGVLGYMTWWGVRLDGVALINLIMCIGFSVDYSAHISYHYIVEENKSSKERIRSSLYALGIPILQGAGSTILGVLGLAFAPSYIFVTFFKMIFLVVSLGILHGLIFLPVFLSLFSPSSCFYKQENDLRKSKHEISKRRKENEKMTSYHVKGRQNEGVMHSQPNLFTYPYIVDHPSSRSYPVFHDQFNANLFINTHDPRKHNKKKSIFPEFNSKQQMNKVHPFPPVVYVNNGDGEKYVPQQNETQNMNNCHHPCTISMHFPEQSNNQIYVQYPTNRTPHMSRLQHSDIRVGDVSKSPQRRLKTSLCRSMNDLTDEIQHPSHDMVDGHEQSFQQNRNSHFEPKVIIELHTGSGGVGKIETRSHVGQSRLSDVNAVDNNKFRRVRQMKKRRLLSRGEMTAVDYHESSCASSVKSSKNTHQTTTLKSRYENRMSRKLASEVESSTASEAYHNPTMTTTTTTSSLSSTPCLSSSPSDSSSTEHKQTKVSQETSMPTDSNVNKNNLKRFVNQRQDEIENTREDGSYKSKKIQSTDNICEIATQLPQQNFIKINVVNKNNQHSKSTNGVKQKLNRSQSHDVEHNRNEDHWRQKDIQCLRQKLEETLDKRNNKQASHGNSDIDPKTGLVNVNNVVTRPNKGVVRRYHSSFPYDTLTNQETSHSSDDNNEPLRRRKLPSDQFLTSKLKKRQF